MTTKNLACPCCSGLEYEKCCKPFHNGILPVSALQLMRSRYSAYALNFPDYLMKTVHPKNLQYTKDQIKQKKAYRASANHFTFHKLKILDFKEEINTATVTFTAYISQDSTDMTFTEKSLFEKVNGQWLYLSGQISKGDTQELAIFA